MGSGPQGLHLVKAYVSTIEFLEWKFCLLRSNVAVLSSQTSVVCKGVVPRTWVMDLHTKTHRHTDMNYRPVHILFFSLSLALSIPVCILRYISASIITSYVNISIFFLLFYLSFLPTFLCLFFFSFTAVHFICFEPLWRSLLGGIFCVISSV